jgi:hypothetical protein
MGRLLLSRRNRFPSPKGSRPPRFRPLLEALEERDMPTTFFVVPGNVATDATHFHTLSAAVGAASAGGVIQIEPNSTPGAANGNLTNPVDKQLTIRGDPAAGPASLPQITSLLVAANGVMLNNLNLSTIILNIGVANTTIANSLVDGLLQDLGIGSGGSSTVLSGNTFTSFVALRESSGDQVLNNTFTSVSYLFLGNETAALVRGNTFVTPENIDGAGITVYGGSTTVVNNALTLGDWSVGIDVLSPAGVNASGILRDNLIETGTWGFGIRFQKSVGVTFNFEVDGNDLARAFVGVSVGGDGTSGSTAFGTIDLGGGALGSPGGNDFHGYTGANEHFAVWTYNGTATTASVSARGNIFSVASPAMVVQAQAGSIDVGGALDANTAFVATLYRDYLKRTGSPGEWAGWVNLLPGMGQGGVASAIIHSSEASLRLVDGLYLKILGRAAEPAGESGWAGLLQNGGTEEQVAAALLASPEFGARADSLAAAPASRSANYAEALYQFVLGRAANATEIGFWVAQLPAMGRSAVAASFLNSAELRQDVVKSLYFSDPANQTLPLPSLAPNLLHRTSPPSAAELAGWAATGMDLLGIEAAIAGSAEAFSNS